MTKAERYVSELYASFEGRAPFTVGYEAGFEGAVYPFVYENNDGIALGLIGLSATNKTDPIEVQLYHISAFKPGRGHGKEMMEYLCAKADRDGVKLYLQAEIQFTDQDTPIGGDLVSWYRQFDFVGTCFMCREPSA